MEDNSLLLPDIEFQRHLDDGRFMIQRERQSGHAFYYPRVAEPGTGSTQLEWFEASGKGLVYATTVVRVKAPGESYNVALIDLAEGPRVTSKVVGMAPGEVRIGLAVRARIESSSGQALLVFEADPSGVSP